MTIKEVAKLAGVSPAAVSRYMNGGSLSEAKRAIIRQAIEQTGYRPSMAARVMRTGELNQIGIIVPKIYSDSVAQIIEGANDKIRNEGYMLVVCATGGDEERELTYLDLMDNNQAAGVILMGTSVTPLREDAYRECKLPLVITGQNVSGVPCVYHDDMHALKDLAHLLLKKGRKQIAYIGVSESDPQAGTARREGVIAAFLEEGRKTDELIATVADFDAKTGYTYAKEILEKFPSVDGIICATDTIAIGALRAITEQGRQIGKDISIVGVGDNWMNAYSGTPLTTAHYYYRQCGEEAAGMLLEAIAHAKENKPFPARQICLEYKIIERGSI